MAREDEFAVEHVNTTKRRGRISILEYLKSITAKETLA